jgi:predicted nucleotidyltransferase component of viral defense system
MTYRSGASFRRALEDRLRAQSLETGAPLVRLRKMVVFDRFLVRLTQDQPDAWVLKGGFALQLRLGNQARTTKDIDVLLTTPYDKPHDVHQALVRGALLDLGDWFQFEVERPTAEIPEEPIGGVRFQVRALLDNRRFETFHIDVGWGEPLIEPVDTLSTPALLGFAGIPPTAIPCYSLTQQVAEKVHAYTRPRASGEGSRVKDLVDILLIAELRQMDGPLLQQALQTTFDTRRTHPMPTQFPDPPATWSMPFRRLAEETGLGYRMLSDASEAARVFLDPVLRGGVAGKWDPMAWSWTPGP